MSCPCTKLTSSSGEELPSLSDLQNVTSRFLGPAPSTSVVECVDGEAVPSTQTEGTTLAATFADAVVDCDQEGITLLGRIGLKLAKFVGSGFIQLVDGKAYVVQSVVLRVSALWHRWWKTSGINKRPILGEPLDYPYQVIADNNGILHAIQGKGEESSISVWDPDAKLFSQVPLSEIPFSQKGLLQHATEVEIVGLTPLPTTAAVDAVRSLATLYGEGMLVITKQDTVAPSCSSPGCAPLESKAAVARFLAFPPSDDATYTLKCTNGVPSWVEDV